MQKSIYPAINCHIPLATALATLLLLTGLFNFLLRHTHRDLSADLRSDMETLQVTNTVLNDKITALTGELTQLQNNYEQSLQTLEELKSIIAASGPVAYLTFDDGPSKVTVAILEILAEHNIKTTFFPIGYNHSGDENIFNRIISEGHALGNHTYTHHYKTIYQSADAFMADLRRLENLIYSQTGHKPNIVRFPGGSSNTLSNSTIIRDIIAALHKNGYEYFDWNVSSGDANSSLLPEQLVENVLTQVDRLGRRDVVILLHDNYVNHNTLLALPHIIEGLQKRGYRFAPLSKGAINMKHR